MKATLRVSTGARIIAWREQDTYHAQLEGAFDEPQICLAIDLFEVVAELGGLDLEEGAQAAEAIALAERAQRLLGDELADPDSDDAERSDDLGESYWGSRFQA